MQRKNKLSTTIVGFIEGALNETQSKDRYLLCEKIANDLEERYLGYNFDYQTKRMNVDTTKKILNAIDIYMEQYQ